MGRITSYSEIGAAIKKCRNNLSFSQEALAAELNVSTQQVHRYESGKDKISIEKLQIVAQFLSVSVSYLLNIPSESMTLIRDPSEQELLSHFRSIKDMSTKKVTVNLIERISIIL